MRPALLAALAGLASAQVLDLDFLNAIPDPTFTIALDQPAQTIAYNPAAVIASDAAAVGNESPLDVVVAGPQKRSSGAQSSVLEARQAACAAAPTTPNIYNAVIDPAESFSADQNLEQQALQASTPALYTNTFTNLKAAVTAHGYLGYNLLPSYNTTQCAAKCNKIKGCQGFNLYFERSPSVVPGPNCRDPPGTPNIWCVFWGGPVFPEVATNKGQYRASYHVVISGSNGYTLTSTLGPYRTKAIDAPKTNCNNETTFLGYRLFNDGAPFDVNRCAAVCSETSSYNIVHNANSSVAPQLCKFFDTYLIFRNWVSQGQYCALYSQYYDPSVYATNGGSTDAKGNVFTIASSVFFSNATDIVTPVCPSDVAALQSDAAAGAYCTSVNSYVAPTTTTTTTLPTNTVKACGGAAKIAKRDSGEDGLVEAVVGIYPEKIDPSITDVAPAMVTIPAESLSVPSIFASASSEAISSLGLADSTATATATASSATSTDATITAAKKLRRAVATPSILAGRDPREVASVCSKVATGTATSTSTLPAPTTYDTSSCNVVPRTCPDRTPASIIAGSYTSSNQVVDDVYFTVNLPFPVCIYSKCSTIVHPSSNGVLGLDASKTIAYTNQKLPWGNAVHVGDSFLYPFWDDLFIYLYQPYFMDYLVCGPVGSRVVSFNWYLAKYGDTQRVAKYSFSAIFYEAKPGVIDLKYYSTPDQGSSATIGVEGIDASGSGKLPCSTLTSHSSPNHNSKNLNG
jgi:hypothetical protein